MTQRGPQRFRKKPVVVDAVQWNGENIDEVCDLGYAMDDATSITPEGKLKVETLEGTMTADVYDWIIRGIKGELYPCKPGIFEATYESVDG